MTKFDLIIGPLVFFVVIITSWFIRPYVSDIRTKKYYFPALILKIIAAIGVGLVYTYYYHGGDTFTYYSLGSRHIFDAFMDSPVKGLRLITTNFSYESDTYKYAARIYTYGDSASYFVVRVAGIFGILVANSYTGIAILFGLLSFTGLWAMYQALYRMYPAQYKIMAITILFVPSVIFWGSGVLKDSITLGALGWLTWSVIYTFHDKNRKLSAITVGLVAMYIIYTVKIYILLCFIPGLILWLILYQSRKIKSFFIRVAIFPILIASGLAAGYFSIVAVGASSTRYSFETLQKTAEETARWNYFVSSREGGSGYTLGDYDFTTTGMIKKFPKAVWVALFRPYLWEVRNIMMLITSIESFAFLLLTIYVVFRTGIISFFSTISNEPLILFFLVFAIFFGYAAGLTTYNFGSLARYKIPFIPFYLTALALIYARSRESFRNIRA